MYEVVTQKSNVGSALKGWLARLKPKAQRITRRITTPGQSEPVIAQLLWFPSLHLWMHVETKSNGRFHWSAYGHSETIPSNPVNVTLEINPVVVNQKRARGRLLRDERGRLFLAHKGGRGGGRGRQVSIDEFRRRIKGVKLVNARWGDGTEERLFLLGELTQFRTVSLIAKYVKQAEILATDVKERASFGDLIDYIDNPKNTLPGSTETRREIQARLGQGSYRRAVLRRWNDACAITGINNKLLLRASHIRPWTSCADESDRINAANGLPLVPNYDALFDSGLISFKDDGRILLSSKLRDEDRRKLGLKKRLSRGLHADEQKFMEFHRRKVFKK